MPKPHTFPTLYNEALQINISNLKDWGYLLPGQIKSGIINWSSNGTPTACISIQVNTHNVQPYIELEYKYRGEPRKYKVFLTSTPSNLKLGEIWYFICPQTKKLCRKLYLIGGYFFHREAFTGCMYEAQTHSKKERFLKRFIDWELGQAEELNSRYFKCYYAGKPTKRYIRILKRHRKRQNISYAEIRQFFLT